MPAATLAPVLSGKGDREARHLPKAALMRLAGMRTLGAGSAPISSIADEIAADIATEAVPESGVFERCTGQVAANLRRGEICRLPREIRAQVFAGAAERQSGPHRVPTMAMNCVTSRGRRPDCFKLFVETIRHRAARGRRMNPGQDHD
jgi:hypothetical protein